MANLDHMQVHFRPELGHLREHEETVDRILTSNLGRHASAGFGDLPLNPELYPFQRMDCVKVTGPGMGAEGLRGLAAFVYPGVEVVIEYLKAEREDLLDEIREMFKNDESLTLLTNHLDVKGVAVAGGAILCALQDKKKVDPKEINSELFVSSMMKRTTLHGQPTVGLITQAFRTLRFSLPTSNESNRDIPAEIRDPFNQASLDDIDKHPAAEPTFRMIAGSGTSDRKSGRRLGTARTRVSPTVHMGPMSNRTKDLAEKTRILGMGLDTGIAEPDFYIGNIVDASEQMNGAHDVMFDIAKGMSAASRFKRVYHITRESFNTAAPKPKKNHYGS